jgi:hypothetical protein
MPEGLGRNLRGDPLPEKLITMPAVVKHVVRSQIFDMQRTVQDVLLFGRHQNEGSVSVHSLPDDPPAHHWLKKQHVKPNAPFLEVLRPPTERPRHHRFSDECAANNLRDLRYSARIGRTNLHHGSSIRRRSNAVERY